MIKSTVDNDPLLNPPKPSNVQQLPNQNQLNTLNKLVQEMNSTSSSQPISPTTESLQSFSPTINLRQTADPDLGRSADPLSRTAVLDPLSRPPSQQQYSLPRSLSMIEQVRRDSYPEVNNFFGVNLPKEKRNINMAEFPEGIQGVIYLIEKESYSQAYEYLDMGQKKFATTPEDKIYIRVLKGYLLLKLKQFDKMSLEFSLIGNLDKIIEEKLLDNSIPYNLRLFHALNAYILKPHDDKCLERLFTLCEYCEKHIDIQKMAEYHLCQQETFDIKILCDIEVPPSLWVARLFKAILLISEILLERNEIKTAIEILEKSLIKFPNNQILLSLLGKAKLKKGEFTNSRILFEQVINVNPAEAQSELNMFNWCFQNSYEKKSPELKDHFNELSSKYPNYKHLADNNIAYLLTADGQVQQAIEILENTIKSNPQNINEAIVFNLLSLYDFYYDDARDRKRIIEEIIDKYAKDSFNKAYLGSLLKKQENEWMIIK